MAENLYLTGAGNYARDHRAELEEQKNLAIADGEFDYALFMHNLVRGLSGEQLPPAEESLTRLGDLLTQGLPK